MATHVRCSQYAILALLARGESPAVPRRVNTRIRCLCGPPPRSGIAERMLSEGCRVGARRVVSYENHRVSQLRFG